MSLFTSWVSSHLKPISRVPAETLNVEQVPSEKVAEIRKIAKEWEKIAKAKSIASSEDSANVRLSDCAWIAAKLAAKTNELAMKDKIFTCKDGLGTVQGLALVSDKVPTELYVEYLVTNPINIRCKVNELELDRVEGTGRAFCQFAAIEAPKHGKKLIRLQPTRSAENFYLKCGYKWDNFYMTKKLPPVSKL